jgi:hypothetical protein
MGAIGGEGGSLHAKLSILEALCEVFPMRLADASSGLFHDL